MSESDGKLDAGLDPHASFPSGHTATSLVFCVGTLVLTLNVILLGGYTLGCHSFRHLVGGRLDHYGSEEPPDL